VHSPYGSSREKVKRMHVARVCHHFYSAKNMKVGLATHFYNLAMTLKKQGVRQTIVCGDSDVKSGGVIEGIRVFKYPKITPFEMLNSGKAAFKKIKELQKSGEKFDIIHYHQPIFFKIHDFKQELGGIPIIQTTHGSPSDVFANIDWLDFTRAKESLYYCLFTLFSARKADAFVCVSPGVREDLIEKLKLSPKKVFAITPGINPKHFFYKKAVKKFDILNVSRFSPGKRYADLIGALGILKRKGISFKAGFIGEYGFEKNLEFQKIKHLALKLGVLEFISFLPPTSQERLGDVYRSAKVFVLPSISESAPKVTLEAMACGVPCIVSDIIGNQGITLDGKTGFIVPKKNPEAIAEKLELLLSDSKLREKMSKQAARHALKEFPWEVIAKKYASLYKSIAR